MDGGDPARAVVGGIQGLEGAIGRARRRGCRLPSALPESAVKSTEIRPIATNRKARHTYEVMDTFEAGLVLSGTEVKSLRGGKASMGEAYVRIRNGEAWLENCHIAAYDHASQDNHDPRAPRKLLLRRREIRKLAVSVQQKGLTIVPLRLYFRGAWVKVEIAVARGKKLYDKRQSLKKSQAQRDIDRARRAR